MMTAKKTIGAVVLTGGLASGTLVAGLAFPVSTAIGSAPCSSSQRSSSAKLA